jgi:hypothetical protein
MFEGVPERLTAAVRDARNDFKDDSIYVMAAGLVMVEYLRKQIDDPDKPHDFLQNRKNQDGVLIGNTRLGPPQSEKPSFSCAIVLALLISADA